MNALSGINDRLKKLKESYLNIQTLVDETHNLFQSASKDKSSEVIKYTNAIFTRIYLFSENIKHLIKNNDDPQDWDYRIMYLIVRSIMETVEMLFYVSLEEDLDENKLFRINYLKLKEVKYTKFIYTKDEIKKLPEANRGQLNHRYYLWEREIEELTNKIISCKYYKRLNESQQKRVLFGRSKYFYTEIKEQESDSAIRSYIEQKMGIIPTINYEAAYHLYSSMVHPYDISSDLYLKTNKATNKMYWEHIIYALNNSILYIRYSALNIITKVLLSSGMDKDINDSERQRLEKIKKELEKKPFIVTFTFGYSTNVNWKDYL